MKTYMSYSDRYRNVTGSLVTQMLIYHLDVPRILVENADGDTEMFRKRCPDFFQILQLRVMRQEIFRKLLHGQFHKNLP